jgi:hypothetical protein
VCGNKLFNAVIEILSEFTTAQWGFVQSRRKVSYVTSSEIKMKIGLKKCDYNIKTSASAKCWKQSLKFELCLALADFAKKNPSAPIDPRVGTIGNEIKVADCMEESQIDLSKCREFNKYQSTFIHAPTSWITQESIILESCKNISREDYM